MNKDIKTWEVKANGLYDIYSMDKKQREDPLYDVIRYVLVNFKFDPLEKICFTMPSQMYNQKQDLFPKCPFNCTPWKFQELC